MSFSSGASAQGDELFLTINAQDVLVVTSAAISFAKSLISVSTYSIWQVYMSIVELLLTALALALFIIGDYNDEDTHYNNDKKVFLVAFILSIMIEVLDVLVTYSTVAVYKAYKKNVKYDRVMIDNVKKEARKQYLIILVLLSCFISAMPVAAFGRSGWNINYFAPSSFSGNNGVLLYVSIIISLVQHGITTLNTCGLTFESIDLESAGALCSCRVTLFIFLSIPAWSLMYTVLARVSSQREAGSLAYLTLINSFQMVEMGCEFHRLMYVIKKKDQAEKAKKDSVENNSDGQDVVEIFAEGNGTDDDDQALFVTAFSDDGTDDGVDIESPVEEIDQDVVADTFANEDCDSDCSFD